MSLRIKTISLVVFSVSTIFFMLWIVSELVSVFK